MHMLVVDDDSTVRSMLVDLLSVSGHTARDVARGSEALALLQTERFDAVLLDHSMPEMTGLEVLDQLRAVGVDSPIGCITGSRGHPDIEKLRDQAVPVLLKPFTAAEFAVFVERLQALRVTVSSQ